MYNRFAPAPSSVAATENGERLHAEALKKPNIADSGDDEKMVDSASGDAALATGSEAAIRHGDKVNGGAERVSSLA